MVALPAFAQRDGGPVEGPRLRELPEFVPGSMWVKLDKSRPEFHDATMHVVRTLAGAEMTTTYWLVPGLHLVRVPVGSERALVSLARELDGVEWTSVEGVGTATQAPPATCVPADRQCNDEYCSDQYWIDSINLRNAWAALEGMQLPLVTVAVIDSGVNYNHPDLIENMWVNAGEIPGNLIDDDANGIVDDVHGAAFVMPPVDNPCLGSYSSCTDYPSCETCEPGPGNPLDKYSFWNDSNTNCGIDTSALDGNHGTACAAIIAAAANSDEIRGIACNVRVMALRVYHRCFLDTWTESNYVEAMQYAALNGATVISSSLQLFPQWGAGNAMYDGIKSLAYYDIVYVSAAGNAAQNVDNPTSPLDVLPPQQFNWDHMLTVGATDATDAIATFSNWGPQTVDLMAPGVSVRVFKDNTIGLFPGSPFVDGTAFAAPMVAGAVALYRSLNPTHNAAMSVVAVKASVRQVAGLANLCESGGVLDVHDLITP